MAKYRNALPQLAGGIFLTDGGLETDLIFHEGFEMPLFASFPLLESEAGMTALRNYYLRFAQVATEAEVGFILEARNVAGQSRLGRAARVFLGLAGGRQSPRRRPARRDPNGVGRERRSSRHQRGDRTPRGCLQP